MKKTIGIVVLLVAAGYAFAQTGEVPSDMVRVEGGAFQMGSDSGGYDEWPVHKVTVKSFYMGKYEVTQKEWTAVMGSNPSRFKGDNLPVENVAAGSAIWASASCAMENKQHT